MAIEVKLSLSPEEFDLVRSCVRIAFEVSRKGDKVSQDLVSPWTPRRIKMLEEYLDSGQRPRHGVSV